MPVGQLVSDKRIAILSVGQHSNHAPKKARMNFGVVSSQKFRGTVA